MLWGRPVWTHFQLWNRVVWGYSVLRWITERLKPGDVFFGVGASWVDVDGCGAPDQNGRQSGGLRAVTFMVDFLRYH